MPRLAPVMRTVGHEAPRASPLSLIPFPSPLFSPFSHLLSPSPFLFSLPFSIPPSLLPPPSLLLPPPPPSPLSPPFLFFSPPPSIFPSLSFLLPLLLSLLFPFLPSFFPFLFFLPPLFPSPSPPPPLPPPPPPPFLPPPPPFSFSPPPPLPPSPPPNPLGWLSAGTRVARPRKAKKPRQSVVVVRNGPAPIAGSRPSWSMASGMTVPAKPAQTMLKIMAPPSTKPRPDMAEPERRPACRG